jgi:hypothetical protein
MGAGRADAEEHDAELCRADSRDGANCLSITHARPTLDQVMADSSVFLGPEASSLFV